MRGIVGENHDRKPFDMKTITIVADNITASWSLKRAVAERRSVSSVKCWVSLQHSIHFQCKVLGLATAFNLSRGNPSGPPNEYRKQRCYM